MIALSLRFAFLTLLSGALAGRLGAAEVAADPKTEQEWKAYEKADSEAPSKPWAELTPREQEQWVENHFLAVRTLGLSFIERHPTDPRRWKIVYGFMPDQPRFIKTWGPSADGAAATNSVIDAAAVAAWKARVSDLQAEMAKAADVPVDLRDKMVMREFIKPFNAAMEAQGRGEAIDLPSLRDKVFDFASKYPKSDNGEYILGGYAWLIERQGVANLEAEFARFVDSPNKSVADKAKQKLAFCKIARQPLDIAFSALDGRKVDLKQWRGKVVLVDFWATWCPGCVEELPNVKKVYEKYHAKGFEVVGIALEDAELDPKDTPAEAAHKLEASRKSLTQFISKRQLPWPQYFDGRGWKNEISTRYSLNAIPAMFLLDRDGRIATTRADGDELEKGIQRLLK